MLQCTVSLRLLGGAGGFWGSFGGRVGDAATRFAKGFSQGSGGGAGFPGFSGGGPGGPLGGFIDKALEWCSEAHARDIARQRGIDLRDIRFEKTTEGGMRVTVDAPNATPLQIEQLGKQVQEECPVARFRSTQVTSPQQEMKGTDLPASQEVGRFYHSERFSDGSRQCQRRQPMRSSSNRLPDLKRESAHPLETSSSYYSALGGSNYYPTRVFRKRPKEAIFGQAGSEYEWPPADVGAISSAGASGRRGRSLPVSSARSSSRDAPLLDRYRHQVSPDRNVAHVRLASRMANRSSSTELAQHSKGRQPNTSHVCGAMKRNTVVKSRSYSAPLRQKRAGREGEPGQTMPSSKSESSTPKRQSVHLPSVAASGEHHTRSPSGVSNGRKAAAHVVVSARNAAHRASSSNASRAETAPSRHHQSELASDADGARRGKPSPMEGGARAVCAESHCIHSRESIVEFIDMQRELRRCYGELDQRECELMKLRDHVEQLQQEKVALRKDFEERLAEAVSVKSSLQRGGDKGQRVMEPVSRASPVVISHSQTALNESSVSALQPESVISAIHPDEARKEHYVVDAMQEALHAMKDELLREKESHEQTRGKLRAALKENQTLYPRDLTSQEYRRPHGMPDSGSATATPQPPQSSAPVLTSGCGRLISPSPPGKNVLLGVNGPRLVASSAEKALDELVGSTPNRWYHEGTDAIHDSTQLQESPSPRRDAPPPPHPHNTAASDSPCCSSHPHARYVCQHADGVEAIDGTPGYTPSYTEEQVQSSLQNTCRNCFPNSPDASSTYISLLPLSSVVMGSGETLPVPTTCEKAEHCKNVGVAAFPMSSVTIVGALTDHHAKLPHPPIDCAANNLHLQLSRTAWPECPTSMLPCRSVAVQTSSRGALKEVEDQCKELLRLLLDKERQFAEIAADRTHWKDLCERLHSPTAGDQECP